MLSQPFAARLALVPVAALLLGAQPVQAQGLLQPATPTSVAGTSNLWRAGGNAPAGSPGNFDGDAPTQIGLAGGTARYVTVTNVSGGTFCFGSSARIGAEGGYCTSVAGTDMPATGSISGIAVGSQMFLAGVFLGPDAPSGSAPTRLTYGGPGLDQQATSFSPLLNQAFFIGDGLGAGAAVQQFFVPVGATRLFLGFADSWDGSTAFRTTAGAYADNVGALDATVTLYGSQAGGPISAVPEPGTWALLGTGLAAVGGIARRRRHA